MNTISTIFAVNKLSTCILVISIFVISNCSYSEREYKNRINGISYGTIHKMGSTLTVAVSNIDTISQNTLVDFVCCLEEEESKSGSGVQSIDLCNKYLYIDQLTAKNHYARAYFKPDTTMNHEKRTLLLEYLKPDFTVEVAFDPHKIKCSSYR